MVQQYVGTAQRGEDVDIGIGQQRMGDRYERRIVEIGAGEDRPA